MLKSKDIRRVLIHCDADHVTFQRPNLGKDSHTTTGLGGLDRSHCKGHDRRAVACKDPASESKALRLAHTLHSRDNDLEGASSDSAALKRITYLANVQPQTLTFKLMPKIDDSLKSDIVKWSAFYEHRIRNGSVRLAILDKQTVHLLTNV